MKNKTVMATISILVFLISLVAGMQAAEVVQANPYWGVHPKQPNLDKPLLIVESPGNYSTCTERSALVNFTVTKPSSWNQTVAPFGTPYAGQIESVNVSLNGKQEFQDVLASDNLNGSGIWSKSYSINVDGLNSGINALEVIVNAATFYTTENITRGIVTDWINEYPMIVTDTIYLNFSDASPTPSVTPTPSLTPTSSLTPSPSIPEFPTWIILPLVLAATLLMVIFVGRKTARTSPHPS